MTDVTTILSRIDSGDPSAAAELLPLVYDELRKLAALRMSREGLSQTLQATALVHEAYVRLVDGSSLQRWDSRGHFFAAAAEAMRRICSAFHPQTPNAAGHSRERFCTANWPISLTPPSSLKAANAASSTSFPFAWFKTDPLSLTRRLLGQGRSGVAYSG